MKENSPVIELKNGEDLQSISSHNISKNLQENFQLSLVSNFFLKSSYNELKESKIIDIKIINSKISIFEHFKNKSYFSPEHISLINKIKKNKPNYTLSFLEDFNKISKSPQPFIVQNSKNIFDSFDPNNPFESFVSIYLKEKQNSSFKSNLDKFDFFSKKNNDEIFFNNFSGNKKNHNQMEFFLNHKRKRQGDKKKVTKILISENNKSESLNEDGEINTQDDPEKKDKKIIFLLSKSEKGRNKFRNLKDTNFIKEKKTPGRKKKNSGEVGVHNKFSKDNMMRKLKNKVMESARKLINKIIKNEANTEFKNFKEIRKIEGIYSQELNIKFNFWFYFQKLKEIFQFKMSSKYSKGDLNSNNRLINKIYSIEKKDKFPKTIQLLEMPFHQYYHDIFLGEKKNWYLYYDIKEKENKFQLDFFLNNGVSKLDKDYARYKDTIKNLACSYELFFLKKNPRLSGNKRKYDTESHAKKIIQGLSNEKIEKYKYNFILYGKKYIPGKELIFNKYLSEYRHCLQKKILPSLPLNTILNINKNSFVNSNININSEEKEIKQKNIENKSILNYNINSKKIEDKKKEEYIISKNINNINNINNEKLEKKIINNNTNNNIIKHNLFDVSKKPLFEINKKKTNSNNNKEINYFFVNNVKNINNKITKPALFISKNSYNEQVFTGVCKINNTNNETNQKMEKEIQTENNLIQDDSSQNIEILI